jgi:uncharacterized membrane protein
LPVSLETAIAVFVLSMTGEILIAIPFGVFVLGMDPASAFLVAYPGNLVPMMIILTLFEILDRKFPRFLDSLARRSRRFQKRLQGKYGLVVLFLIIPIVGAYGASTATGLLRINKKQSFLVQCAALAFCGAVEVLVIYLGISAITSS